MPENLQTQLASLPESQRAELAKFLLGTLSPLEEGVEMSWEDELQRRQDQIATGAVTLTAADQFLAEMDERYP